MRLVLLLFLLLLSAPSQAATLSPFPGKPVAEATSHGFADHAFALPRAYLSDTSLQFAGVRFDRASVAHVGLLMLYVACLAALLPSPPGTRKRT